MAGPSCSSDLQSALGDIALSEVADRTRCVPLNHPLVITAREIGVSFGDEAD